jgi:hypothetical protein
MKHPSPDREYKCLTFTKVAPPRVPTQCTPLPGLEFIHHQCSNVGGHKVTKHVKVKDQIKMNVHEAKARLG